MSLAFARIAVIAGIAASIASPAAAATERLYAPTSPFNQPIGRHAHVDPASAVMVGSLVRARRAKRFPLAVREWTVPTYVADADTPHHDVVLRRAPASWAAAYGTPHDFIGPPPGWATDPEPWHARLGSWEAARPNVLQGVPIPDGARPDPELDAHMTILDRATGCEYDLYGAERRGQGWQAVWGNSTRSDGSGVYPQGLASRASGFAGAAGLVRPEELRAGRIRHALVFAYPYTRAGGPVSPATSSDGMTTDADAIPIGARVQLDPVLDLDALRLAPYERTIARALQEYGMILGDTGGALSLYAMHPQSHAIDPYAGLLPRGPYAFLDRIPVGRFRVLELEPQQARRLVPEPSGCGVLS